MTGLTPVQIYICVFVVAVVFCAVGVIVLRMQRTRDELQKEDAAELNELAAEEKQVEDKAEGK